MPSLDHITRCILMTDQDIETAVSSRESAKALFEHLAKVAKPNEGGPKILLVFARMASSNCDWLDGELRVELIGDGELCVFESMTELGGGLRERALPSFTLHVPLAEFTRAVERVPKMIAPLCVKQKSDRRMVLVSSPYRVQRSIPPAPVTIAEEHLIEPLPAAKPPPAPAPSPPDPGKGPVRAPRVPPRPGGKGGRHS
jgi:hypothetical protein